MIDDKDPMQLSEYCSNVCEELKTVIQGMDDANNLNESMRVALEDLGRCVDWSRSVCSLTERLQGHTRN